MWKLLIVLVLWQSEKKITILSDILDFVCNSNYLCSFRVSCKYNFIEFIDILNALFMSNFPLFTITYRVQFLKLYINIFPSTSIALILEVKTLGFWINFKIKMSIWYFTNFMLVCYTLANYSLTFLRIVNSSVLAQKFLGLLSKYKSN